MAGPSWLVDKNRIATKIRSASGSCDPERITWQSNPTRSCPNCQYTIDNSDVAQEWPGLPKGVKFDPTDQEIIWHLLAKSGVGDSKPHPFIEEFIISVEDDGGICCSHPKKLPGVKEDGSASHFFHRSVKAYNTGTRKRRKIHDGDFGGVRWHKTGRTKPVILDGVQRGCKKIMVLYMSSVKGGKDEKTNWVMHQYHLGTEEDEKEGEYVISKIYYQQQQVKQADKTDQDLCESIDTVITPKVDPVTPKSVTPELPRAGRKLVDFDMGQDTPATSTNPFSQLNHPEVVHVEDEVHPEFENPDHHDQPKVENQDNEETNDTENNAQEDPKWWDSESQNLLNSQQLAEGLSLCDDLLQSQSPLRDGHGNGEPALAKPCLADYAKLGPEDLKKDLEACQNIVLDHANIMELDTPPDFRLSQLDFGSQESFLSWGGKVAD